MKYCLPTGVSAMMAMECTSMDADACRPAGTNVSRRAAARRLHEVQEVSQYLPSLLEGLLSDQLDGSEA